MRYKRSRGSAELWEPLRRAGYARPTRLQSRLVPLILSGRDLAVETEGDSGKTAAFILPLLPRLRRGRAGIKAVVVTSSAEDSRKVKAEFQRLARTGKSVSVFALGAEEGGRGEYRGLSRQPDVVIGTPAKIIDHIRRGNLDFSLLQNAVIDCKGEDPVFVDDLRFIFSKLPPKKQTILFAASLGPQTEPISSLLRRPLLLPLSAWKRTSGEPKDLYIEVPEGEKRRAVAALALAEPSEALLVQCSRRETVAMLAGGLVEAGLKARGLREDMSAGEQARIGESFSVGSVPILVATFEAVRRRPLRWVTRVINADLPPSAEAYKPGSVVLEQVVTLGSPGQYHRLQEACAVNPNKASLPADDQVLAGAVRDIVQKIRSEEDPKELARYRRLLRKNAPLALRSYVAAFLLKSAYGSLLAQEASGAAKARLVEKRPPAPPKAKTAEKGPRPARPVQRTRLFISAGKNRGIYPKDLVQLFARALQADPSRISGIRILDAYSFLEIDSELAEKAIAALNGTELKGRKITVNYARKKEGE